MSARVLSTNIATIQQDPGGADRISGINKLPVASGIDVFAPGPHYGDGSGVVGDAIGDTQHHGGMHKAIYAFSREELDFWDPTYRNGYFGENLTTTGIMLEDLLINQQIRIGSVLLEVSIPRSPCRTFAHWLGVKGWLKTFTQRALPGSYFRVIEAGHINPGDAIEILEPPAHDITMSMAFRAKMGDKDLARRVVAAECLPERYHQDLLKLI
ncbi:MOSC domain-containing protein [Corynebacterium crudilactis]|uniref:Molybdenum cofactor biosysynthesis protein n=1 Tax=Corynebacterium crudilactis TaxID=1652495 RepID=A0A172QQH6_9CORY|nr:MOSC domain-containing protein [Corynebacterium crudilactis]ANE02945.1 molybdenum cofactor biosysynthesis protein [Corynebacterium crudilactis]